MSIIDPVALVDTTRYPLHLRGPEREHLLAELQGQLDTVGCAVLKQFIRPEHLPALVAECDRVAPHGHRNFNRTNPYFTQDHPEYADSHPLRRFYDRSNAFVPADHFGSDSALRCSGRFSVTVTMGP